MVKLIAHLTINGEPEVGVTLENPTDLFELSVQVVAVPWNDETDEQDGAETLLFEKGPLFRGGVLHGEPVEVGRG